MVRVIELHHGLCNAARHHRIRCISACLKHIEHRLRHDRILTAGDGTLAVDDLLRPLPRQLIAGRESGGADSPPG